MSKPQALRLSADGRRILQYVGRVLKKCKSGATIDAIREACGISNTVRAESILRHMVAEGRAQEIAGRFYYVPRKRG